MSLIRNVSLWKVCFAYKMTNFCANGISLSDEAFILYQWALAESDESVDKYSSSTPGNMFTATEHKKNDQISLFTTSCWLISLPVSRVLLFHSFSLSLVFVNIYIHHVRFYNRFLRFFFFFLAS